MDREEFRKITSELNKGERIRFQLVNSVEHVGKIYDRGPAYISVLVKGRGGGLRNYLFTHVEWLRLEEK